MSGLGVPARTATPMPDFAKLTRLLATSLACLISSSVPLSPKMIKSAASPAAMRFWTSGVLDHAAETLCPVAFSNWGINSRYASFIATEARSLISEAWEIFGRNRLAATAIINRAFMIVLPVRPLPRLTEHLTVRHRRAYLDWLIEHVI